MISLKDPSLFTQQAYVGGEWVDAPDGKTEQVTNPATGEVLGTVPVLGRDAVAHAVNVAEKAQKLWKKRTAKERSAILMKWYDLMMENQDDLGAIMTAEQGKPLAEAKGEIAYASSFLQWFAEEGKRVYGDVIPTFAEGRRVMVLKEPVGVCAAITPWNFPTAMITRKAGPALAVGCAMVVKPAMETPYSALAMAILAERAGLPKGLLSIVTGEAVEIGAEMTENPKVRKLTFTGSTPVGRLLMRQCADTVKKISLELGGNAPFIVCEDADIDAAVEGAIASKYRNAGQTCVCANRLFVHDAVYDEFAEKYAAKVAEMPVGNGFEDGVVIGPLINEKAVAKVENQVADAVSKGGRILTGGKRHELGGSFFQPTVIADANRDMTVFREETFGPMAPLIRFHSDDEVLEMANDSEFGLASYFYSRDISRIWKLAEGLESGLVGVNVGVMATEVAPFGGFKQSGVGREGSKYGVEDYLEVKYVCIGGIDD
ncbi:MULTISPECIES: NAD-dependent succinate-semialdehyde dehydrogenase [Thalassospira]|jgi:succinate-semialdehyde dehydrogenase/glutarate-semialdehyde dehydrogenase|uniref:NAD-dependent succinate-semialdehyde dehydrogenase n=1 Tax=Thalassospira povalilytica TaxID=732237 RepID=A0A8I1M933_9PROT|nr:MULTISPECIES: NAD-dependent succinate-semialdehyde dehydrogenase [Thalassospira]MEE3047078.1 NAD-dependent succinate-semialdehyde dehydrogenase [Pseudomonadota bacterium]RCK18923.1 succinate-semialdehyde dehydrogenase [Thalassospira profundimaris]HAY47503.1 NAD-dependent succinate-semialdehyde dehydrogenase [Thalassospira sp.]KZB66058.1 NAD-dependent succinate-semialdehyde dehydrogenase [Thalassospira sp. MCCC 1A02491]MBN8197645.1 NAD-dependent succinate-semialdehyde dehydrogenase [Thalasso